MIRPGNVLSLQERLDDGQTLRTTGGRRRVSRLDPASRAIQLPFSISSW
jgi:hypothetical protein